MSNLLRVIIQTGIAATTAVGRAFQKAVRNEMNNLKSRPAASASSDTSTKAKETTTNYAHGITLQEATQILNVKLDDSPAEIQKRYEHLYLVNEKSKGGSFYIQSKVYRARERINAELTRKGVNLDEFGAAEPKVTPPPPASDTKPGDASSKSDASQDSQRS